jgi:DNA primase
MEEKLRIAHQILGSSRRVRDEYLFSCPYCSHHKKKLSINFGKGYWKCWVCDTRGKNIYRLVRKFGTYQQRQKWLELEGRLDLNEFENIFAEMNDVKEEQTIDLPEEFVSLCNKHLPLSSQRPLKYLHSRGLTRQDILKWKIGYCGSGKFGGRIIIPSFNNDGNVNYFVARSYVGHQRKYLNPRAEKDIIFNQLSIDWDSPVILVEGVFDAIVAGENAIPILGSTLRDTTKLFQAIAINDTPVYLALDEDAKKKTGQIVKNMLKYDIELYQVDTHGCEDVGSMSKNNFIERMNCATVVDYDEYFLYNQLRRVNV